jgi:hypothetical protein
VTRDQVFFSIATAIGEALQDDELRANAAAFAAEPIVDFEHRAIVLRGTTDVVQPEGGLYVLADGSTLATPASGLVTLAGELQVGPGDAAVVEAGSLLATGSGLLTARAGAGLYLSVESGATLGGETTVQSQATLGVEAPLDNSGELVLLPNASLIVEGVLGNEGQLLSAGGVVLADELANGAEGHFIGRGDLLTPVINDGLVTCTGDTAVVGDYTNNGTTIVQLGTLAIIGTLIDNGIIIGDVAGGAAGGGGAPRPGDGLAISGDYVAGRGASLRMPDPVWRMSVLGSFDVAVDDQARFDLSLAELVVGGEGGLASVEVLGRDVGASVEGLDRTLPGHFPIRLLRIARGQTYLLDEHDNANDGQESDEALYVEHLVIEADALLVTNGRRVYHSQLTLDGDVDVRENLVPIATCPADVNESGAVDVDDLLLVILDFGLTGNDLATDIDGDGIVTVDDLLTLILSWGPCP